MTNFTPDAALVYEFDKLIADADQLIIDIKNDYSGEVDRLAQQQRKRRGRLIVIGELHNQQPAAKAFKIRYRIFLEALLGANASEAYFLKPEEEKDSASKQLKILKAYLETLKRLYVEGKIAVYQPPVSQQLWLNEARATFWGPVIAAIIGGACLVISVLAAQVANQNSILNSSIVISHTPASIITTLIATDTPSINLNPTITP